MRGGPKKVRGSRVSPVKSESWDVEIERLRPQEHDGMAGTVEAALTRWEQPLLRYAASIVGQDRARDVVQETFLRLWEGAPRSQSPSPGGASRADEGLAPWLFTVCRNRAIDVARKEGRMVLHAETRTPLATPAGTDASAAGAGATPFEAAARREDAARLTDAVSTLPDRQQEVVRLRYHGGLSYKEIAATTGLTATNVGYLLHVALRALRTRIGGDA